MDSDTRDRLLRLFAAVRNLFDPQATYAPNELLGVRPLSAGLLVVLRAPTAAEQELGLLLVLVFQSRRGPVRVPVIGLRERPKAALQRALRIAEEELLRRRLRPPAEVI